MKQINLRPLQNRGNGRESALISPQTRRKNGADSRRLLPKVAALIAALLALGPSPALRAVVTEKVDHDTFADFSAGEFDNISLGNDGRLQLAPAITNLASVTDPIIWAAVQDDKGNLFFGTGNQGKVYKLTPSGELSTFFEPNELMVHALAIDEQGRLYAATSPNGRVYRLTSSGHAEVFCNPGEPYIWAMTFGRDGSLYLATGDHGKILRVPATDNTPAKAEPWFETPEANITALAVDKDGSLLAGTSPHGYLYRIDNTNHAFVVFNSGDKEIKQIAVAPGGAIYVSTFSGNTKSETAPGISSVTVSISTADEGSPASDAAKSDSASKAQPPTTPSDDEAPMGLPSGMKLAVAGGAAGGGGPSLGAIYRVDTNGFYERVWSAPGEAVYSMILLRDGSLLAGTGDKGRIYSITDANHWKLLQKTSDGAQVAALLPDNRESKTCFAATSHPAKIYRLDFALAQTGTYTSKAFDARQQSLWGKLHAEGGAPDGAKLEFSTRSGNTDKPEKTWSDWTEPKPLAAEIAIASPNARYLQYRVQFQRDPGSSATAELRRVRFYYQNENAAPVISRIRIHAEGLGVSKMPMPQMEAPAMSMEQLMDGGSSAAGPGMAAMAAMMMHPPLRVTKSPGLCTVVWEASDPNQDKLTYSVAIRGESEKDWTTLMDKTEDNFYSFDTTGFHEGLYFIKIAASDLPSNTPDTARTVEAVSEPFLIDNTPPALTAADQSVKKDHARFVVNAVDAASAISAATYSLDGKAEVPMRPDSLIFDSTNEIFTIELAGLDKGAHSLLVRVSDEVKNASVLKLNFDVAP